MSAAGIPYLWHGGHMGTIDGNVNQDEAIDWVAQLARDNRLVVMGSEAAPQNFNLSTVPACSWRTVSTVLYLKHDGHRAGTDAQPRRPARRARCGSVLPDVSARTLPRPR